MEPSVLPTRKNRRSPLGMTVSYLRQGRNCGSVTIGSRAALLIDAAHYFQVLSQAFRKARHSIVIVGWDFDSRICLSGVADNSGPALGPLLRQLVEDSPELEIRILIWSLSVLHSPGDPIDKLVGTAWQDHPRIQLRLDREHPFYACHHQKIVVIDDNLAFTGGIDLTVGRRDAPGHRAQRLRIDPDGTSYGPVHDVQAMVDGPAAAALAKIARERWKACTGERLVRSASRDIWPSEVEPDFKQATIGISCTAPRWQGKQAVQEGVQLTKDLLSVAERSIYIEAQYFTADYLADCLVPILLAPDGPEVVLIISANWHSKTERFVLGRNCERLLRRLKRSDTHNRLAAFYPQVQTENGPVRTLVHAKLIIIDDTLLRVGSSNLNNRSVGLDSECDLVVQAQSEADRNAIRKIRRRLLAEHLGTDPTAISQAFAVTGRLIKTIGQYNRRSRGLAPFVITEQGPVRPVFGSALVDPARPFQFFEWPRRAKPSFGQKKCKQTHPERQQVVNEAK
jgi:phosphatidylserine/phosphatidylglycerophosphate/cardiolipin synthase-like enzyme